MSEIKNVNLTRMTNCNQYRTIKRSLTVLLVQQYLDLLLLIILQTGVNASDRLSVRQFTSHERTICSSLHQLRSAVAAQLAEPVVTIDRRIVHYSRVC